MKVMVKIEKAMSRSVFCAISYIKIRLESAQENLKGKVYNFNIKSKHGCSWHGVTMKSKLGDWMKQSPCLWGLRCHIMVMEWTLTIKITCDTLLGLMKVILSVQILLLEVGNKSISVSLDELKIIQKCLNTGDGKRTPLYNVARHTNMLSIVGRGYRDI